MAKAKYQVTRAWHGVAVGQIVELDGIHPSLAAHVIAAPAEVKSPAEPPTEPSKGKETKKAAN